MKSQSRRRRIPRLLAWAVLALLACYALFAYWWQFSGSPFPLAARFESPAGVYTLEPGPRVMRTEAGGAALGRSFYLVGGLGPFIQTRRAVERYDAGTRTWEDVAPLPRPINHPAVVAAAGRIWVLGGFRPLGIRPHGVMLARWDPLDTLYAYDPASGEWSAEAPMPEPRGGGGAAYAAGAIWYVGGINPERGLAADLYRYDLAEGTWKVMPPMPTARDHLRMEAVGDRLFAISGRRDDLRFNLAAVERYDIAAGAWTRVADIPNPRGGLGTTVYEGRIYTFGGELVWTNSPAVERYDPESDRWEELGRLPEARHGICAGVIDGRIHLVSGGRHPRASVSRIHRVLAPPD